MRFLPLWGLVTVVLWGLVAAMTLALVWGVRDRRLADESLSWPQAPGVVIDSAVERQGTYRSATTYRPRIRYRYEVGGQTFEGSRATFRSSLGETDSASLVATYPRDKAIMVFYRPAEPSVSVLVPGGRSGSFLLVVLALGLLVVGAGAIFATFFGVQMARSTKKERTKTALRRS